MAGWTFTIGPTPVGLADNVDAGEKVTAFPALTAGQAGWWHEYCWRIRQEFAQYAQQNGPVPSNITFSANNGASGDVAGIGTLTIVITTS